MANFEITELRHKTVKQAITTKKPTNAILILVPMSDLVQLLERIGKKFFKHSHLSHHSHLIHQFSSEIHADS